MHILVNGWFAGRDTAGSGQYIDHLLRYLPAVGAAYRITVLLPESGDQERKPVTRNHSSLVTCHLSPPHLPRQLAKLWWEQISVPLAARRLGADVLFVPYWAAPLWQPVPTVVTVHDLIPLLLPDYRGGLLNRLYTTLVSLTARRSAAVLTVSEASKRDVVEHLQIPAARVVAVHHGANEGEEESSIAASQHRSTAPSHLYERYALPDRYFLYLGGFDVRKNVAGIIQAYARYRERGGDPTVKLVIAGKLPDRDTAFAPDPRRMAAEQGVTEHVHFTGWVDDADKPLLYAGAMAFLFPSRYEGFGMMVLEAMAAGCPVVTSQE